MKVAIATIQRGRARYLPEWIAFHQVVGFDHFFIYSHGRDTSQDNLLENLVKVDKTLTHYKVEGTQGRPQLRAYQHCWEKHGDEFDAIAFIDGDEFLFSPNNNNIKDVFEGLFTYESSAVAAYWVVYGSSGLVKEPNDLLINAFLWHSNFAHPLNRHFKTILKKGAKAMFVNPHFFQTSGGTFDELSRKLRGPLIETYDPSHNTIRINHYVTQSWEYFVNEKQSIGYIDRPEGNKVGRSDDWFWNHDLNNITDGEILRFSVRTAIRRETLLSAISTQ